MNLQDRTCSCNAWQLSGIPCKHAITSIWNKVDQPEHYVSHYYNRETYLKAYNFLLEPLNGPQGWPVAENDYIVVPPPLKKVKNRPTTKRKPSVGEVTQSGKLKKTGTVIKCNVCGIPGHNKRSCERGGEQTKKGQQQDKEH